MSQIFNIYCDESCHLEHDKLPVMVLGAVWCLFEKAREIASRIREIKVKHLAPPTFEVKWSKVSPGKRELYMALLDYFFDDDDLHFRALIVPDKAKLNHEAHRQTHDEWYYKMYFDMLKVLFNPRPQVSVTSVNSAVQSSSGLVDGTPVFDCRSCRKLVRSERWPKIKKSRLAPGV